MIQIFLVLPWAFFSRWRVSSVSNYSKVSVFCCAEGLGICLIFCNKGVSDWIGNWGVSFGVLGVRVWTESSSFLSDLVPCFLFYFFFSKLLRYKESEPFGVFLFTSTFWVISCDMESLSIFIAIVLDKKAKMESKSGRSFFPRNLSILFKIMVLIPLSKLLCHYFLLVQLSI